MENSHSSITCYYVIDRRGPHVPRVKDAEVDRGILVRGVRGPLP